MYIFSGIYSKDKNEQQRNLTVSSDYAAGNSTGIVIMKI